MREGCLIGCLGLIAVAMILAIVAVVLLDGFFGLFREADRVALTEYYGQDHDLMVLVEPTFDLIGAAVAEASDAPPPWFIDYVLPYEVTLFVTVDREEQTTTYTAAASLKRMAGFLSYYLPRGESFTIFDHAEVMDLGVTSQGVAYLVAKAPIAEETENRAQLMNQITEPDPYRIDGGHLAQIVLNNTRGNAFIALQEFFNGSEAGAASGDLLTPDDELVLGQNITTARLTFNAAGADTVSLNVQARLVDPDVAPEIIPLLDEAVRQLAQSENRKVEVEGVFRQEGRELIGDYTLKHVRSVIGKRWEESLQEFERQMERPVPAE